MRLPAFLVTTLLLYPAQASAEPLSISAGSGVMSIGLGRGDALVGVSLAQGVPLGQHFLLSGELGAWATGFVGRSPGVLSRASGRIGFVWPSIRFDVGGEIGLVSFRACGTSLCGRVSGIVPGLSASAGVRLSDHFFGTLWVSSFWTPGSRVLDGPNLSLAIGPTWTFGGSK